VADQERDELQGVICRVKGVEAASVIFSNSGEISEIHIAASPTTRAKNLARDVRSYLAATLGINVNHQKISVAVRDEVSSNSPLTTVPQTKIAVPTEPAPNGSNRLLFRSVNLLVEGLRSEVQVDLTYGNRELTGSATGVPAVLGTERVIVEATLAAVSEMIAANIKLLAGDLTVTRIGAGEVVLAEVILVESRREQQLVGVCPKGQDRHRAVVFAVLSALNRILSRITKPGKWVEFQVEADPEMP